MPAIPYERPNRIWVSGDNVFAETYDGQTVVMSAETALYISRLLGLAGGNAIINRMGGAGNLIEGDVGRPETERY